MLFNNCLYKNAMSSYRSSCQRSIKDQYLDKNRWNMSVIVRLILIVIP